MRWRKRDHPRRCGENYILNCEVEYLAGSPPQVRGKRDFAAAYRRDPRITPAGAGKTATDIPLPGGNRDHPRRCGENYQLFFSGAGLRGSPPQVRGKLPLLIEGIVKGRITPAGAGKTPI